MRLIDPKTFRLELDKLDCIDKFGHVSLPITKLNIALERSEVDAVPVCRCKDCKHSKGACIDLWGKPAIECITGRTHSRDWFCADGKRKGGDE